MIPRTSACDVELPMAHALVGKRERRSRAMRALDQVGPAERVAPAVAS